MGIDIHTDPNGNPRAFKRRVLDSPKEYRSWQGYEVQRDKDGYFYESKKSERSEGVDIKETHHIRIKNSKIIGKDGAMIFDSEGRGRIKK